MNASLLEIRAFTSWVTKIFTDDEYSVFQHYLKENPQAGTVMPGCGGLRKIRFSDPKRGKGKRGGVRIIYYHIPEVRWIYLIYGYDKDEADDLTPDQKKVFASLAKTLKEEALQNNPK